MIIKYFLQFRTPDTKLYRTQFMILKNETGGTKYFVCFSSM